MKYIKTSSGKIIDLSHYPQETINDPLASKDLAIYLKSYGYGEIVKQADTIEELCDAFVNKFNTGRWMITKNLEQMVFAKEGEFITEIYGAIWTDKGLIYVAKMNEEGVFELL